MKVRVTLGVAVGLIAAAAASVAFAGSAESVLGEIKAVAAMPAVIDAVKSQNGQKLTMDEIKARDTAWTAASGHYPLGDEMMKSKISQELLKVKSSKAFISEIILTDNQGANVGISDLTSDYWQGDEPKFANAFAGGAGSDYIARPKKDDSTGETIAQVSVPVKDGAAVIGTLTVGVRLDKVP